MIPIHPQPVAPRREVATMVARQRQSGAGPVDPTVIVVESAPKPSIQADSARITANRSDLPSKPMPGKSGMVR